MCMEGLKQSAVFVVKVVFKKSKFDDTLPCKNTDRFWRGH